MSSYNIISLPFYTLEEAKTVGKTDDYKKALTAALKLAGGNQMEPIQVPSAVASLTRYHPLQGWVLREKNGDKLAILAIQKGEDECLPGNKTCLG